MAQSPTALTAGAALNKAMTNNNCDHEFHVSVEVFCFEDKSPLGQLELTAKCEKCEAVLEFIGIECGVNLNGPSVSPDNREVRLAVNISLEPPEIKHTGAKVHL